MAPFTTASSFESANVPPGNQRTSLAASTGMPCSCLLSSASRVLLFFNQPAIERPSHPALPFDAVRVHKLVSSAIDQCFRSVVEHPLLKPLMGLSTALTQAFQMPFQNSRYSARSQTSFHGLNFAAILPGDTVAGLVVANGLTNFLNIYNTLLVVRLLLTWFPNTPPAIVSPLSTLCDPYLNIFRGIIPPLGGTLDLSPILAFLVLNAFTSTASALPAELPPSGTSNRVPSLPHHWDLTTVQNKWLKRLKSKETKSRNGRGLQGNGS